jgi:hypothetical protein
VAATKRYNALDLNQNEIQNAVIQVLASDPGSPVNGQIWYNSTGNVFKVRINGVTVQFGRLDQMSAPTASLVLNSQKITGLLDPGAAQDAATQNYVLTRNLSSFTGANSADVPLNSHKLTGVLDPTGPQDAATKNYVDGLIQGLDIHDSVRAATTADMASATYTAAGGTSARGQFTTMPNTIDGVTLAANDRVLVKNQTTGTGAANGIYVVTTLGTGANGVWDRALDFDQDPEAVGQPFVWVEEGTANADTGWAMTTNGVIVLGGASGTVMVWSKFASAATPGTAKFTATIGDGSTTAITVTDNLGTSDKVAIVRDAGTNAQVECDITYASTTTTTFTFTVAPTTNQFKVVIIG